jgi:hypothetical protein
MPCRDDYGPSEPTIAQSTYDTLEAVERATQKRCDQATRVACEIEKLLSHEQFGTLTKEAQTWIKKHRDADAAEKKREEERQKREQEVKARREKNEQAHLAALKKLTREERNILGLPHPA